MGIGSVIVGDPVQVADELQQWVDQGAHGFNLACAVRPGTMEGFVEYYVPELQNRGMMQTEYKEGTMREKLFGHRRLQAPHRRSNSDLEARANPVCKTVVADRLRP